MFWDYFTPIAASIIGGLIGGLFTYLGVKRTINYQEKMRLEDLKREQEERFEATKPEFSITEYREPHKYDGENADLVVLVAFPFTCNANNYTATYSQETVDHNKWLCADYILQNIGLTEIENIYIASDRRKNAMVFDVKNNEYIEFGYQEGRMQYSTRFRRVIKPQEKLSLKICYLESVLNALIQNKQYLTIWFEDFNHNFWEQTLFYPPKKDLTESAKASKLVFFKYNHIPSDIELMFEKGKQ